MPTSENDGVHSLATRERERDTGIPSPAISATAIQWGGNLDLTGNFGSVFCLAVAPASAV
jgi:hypothetical protein